ncbi:hypothetical protein KJ940_02870, partial [Myxococcota bacterium]|nr:hypothetical protein [Myxococcota bacterium]
MRYLVKKHDQSIRRIFAAGKAFDGAQWKYEDAQVRCLVVPIDFPSKDLLFKSADGIILAPGFEPVEGLLEHFKAHLSALEACERAILAPAPAGPFRRADSDAQKLFEVLFRRARSKSPALDLRGASKQSRPPSLSLNLGEPPKPPTLGASRRSAPEPRPKPVVEA